MPDNREDVLDSSSGSESEGDSGSTAGNQGGTKPEDKGRSLDNLRGEFDRRQAKLEGQISALTEATERLANMLLQAKTGGEEQRFNQGNRPAYEPSPQRQRVPQHSASDLSEYTDEQLQQALASGQLSPTQARLVERTLQERSFDSQFEQKFQAREKQSAVERLREESETAALASFPALRDKNSEFSRRVELELQRQRKIIGEVATDRFDVANRIARQMGVEVARVVTPGYVGKPESAGPETPAEPEGQSVEEIREIASSLRYALPIKHNPKTGKMERQKFNLERIQERSKRYQKNEQVFKAGRKIKGNS